jgi:DNA mismatch repair protein MutL
MNAYQEMIPSDTFPMYVLFIELDPQQVDVNVHPTKQEIKFEDEKIIYAFVQAAIKHALAQFSVTPTLDFSLDASIQQLSAIQQPFTEKKQEAVSGSSIFKGFTQKNQAHFIEPSGKSDLKHWKDFYEPPPQPVPETKTGTISTPLSFEDDNLRLRSVANAQLTLLLNTYIVMPLQQGFILVNQQAAHERVLYEQMTKASKEKPVATQRSMFPVTLELSPADAAIMSEITGELHHLGYNIEPFGKNSFVIQGTPADVGTGNEKHTIDILLDQYKHFSPDNRFSKREKLIRSLARQQCIKTGTHLTEREMKQLLSDLLSCEQPNRTPDGYPVYVHFTTEQLEKLFEK